MTDTPSERGNRQAASDHSEAAAGAGPIEPQPGDPPAEDSLSATGPGPGLGERPPAEEQPVYDFGTVLDLELEAVREGRRRRLDGSQRKLEGKDAVGRAHDARLSGFAVSGGGIRSATFNLGVIQALAQLGLLRRFDFLSVNSGGGYIGGWLGAWIRRKGIREVESALANDACRGGEPAAATPDEDAAGAQDEGPFEGGSGAIDGDDVEAAPIRFLRRFSNYLTPQVGAFSADTWTMVATYLRNLLLNLGVVVLLLGVILLSPRLLLLLSRVFESDDALVVLGLAVAFLLVAIVWVGLNLATIFPEKPREWPWYTGQGWVQGLVVLPLFVAAWLAALWLWFSEAGALAELADDDGTRDLSLARWLAERWDWYGSTGLGAQQFEVFAWALLAAAVYLAVWLFSAVLYLVVGRLRRRQRPAWEGRVWRVVIATAPLAGAVGGTLLFGLTALSEALESVHQLARVEASWHLLHVNVWKPPGVIAIFMITAFVHTGLMGRAFPESMRQWWSRLGAWMLIYSVTWLGLFGIAIYGPIVLALAGQWAFAALSAGWAGMTAAGVAVGRQAARAETTDEAPSLWRRLVIAAAPQIFIVGLLALVALGLHLILSPHHVATAAASGATADGRPAMEAMGSAGLSEECGSFWGSDADGPPRPVDAAVVFRCHSQRLWNGTTAGRTLALLGVLLIAGIVLSWRVDINEFSMHQFYRNRLIRAYLGASNGTRRAHPFTGFDPGDDLALASFTPARGYDGPYPIHNVTLNLVAGKELAWQERKGASFVFTPLATGFEVHEAAESDTLEGAGFRPTAGYRQTDNGISLGTAMAISGAAASPNMGAGTTPPMAFLLTVFNVRLGWWLGNPRHKKTWPRMGPSVGAAAMLAELFGSTDDTSRYVYLSDGGHFENLGVYELVRRRCRFILASDAGADPESTFQDLGNAIRKCCTDFGIDIEIDTARLQHEAENRRSPWHCAVGSIRYDKVDPGAAPGVLLYIKSSLTGDEARDVLTYGVDRPTFPHESTADQWFGESQFESYRKLGEHVALKVLRRADDHLGSLSQEALMVRLQEAWFPPSGAAEGTFTRHAGEVDELFERLRTDPTLHFLIDQIYPEWQAVAAQVGEAERQPPTLWLPATHDELIAGFLFCHSLIQQMENVYLDLDLESQYGHPDNRGWMNLFKHWTWAGMVRATWAVTVGTFGARFQSFCRRRLGFEPGRLVVEESRLPGTSLEPMLDGLEENGTLNFLEVMLIRDFVKLNAEAAPPDRLLVLRVEVGEPAAEVGGASDGFRFTFGFALASGEKLLFLRVQDHLRKMGLGRSALRRLVREHGVSTVETVPLERMPAYSRSRAGEARGGALRALFRSVVNERGEV